MRGRSAWIGLAAAVAALTVVAAIVASLWRAVGDVEISAAGWVAMTLGAVLTLALGIGLMALVFFSNRRGYDDQAGDEPRGDRHG